jgi:hypothetical protein
MLIVVLILAVEVLLDVAEDLTSVVFNLKVVVKVEITRVDVVVVVPVARVNLLSSRPS